MLVELGCIAAGAPLGLALRGSAPVVRWVRGGMALTVYVLLFLLGVSLGGNPALLEGLGDLGVRGALIGLLCALGSALAARLLHRRIFGVPPHETPDAHTAPAASAGSDTTPGVAKGDAR